jgi:predicted metal-dependent hydrolase
MGPMPQRDRDDTGNARNARPRDELGRPLPHGSAGVPRIPDDLNLAAAESLSYAQQLLDRGLAFNAHEVLEAAWKNGPLQERALWQGLAQLAVGITHVQRGNVTGGIAVLDRAAARLGAIGSAPHHIDAGGLVKFTETLIEELRAGEKVAPNQLRPRLVISAADRRAT